MSYISVLSYTRIVTSVVFLVWYILMVSAAYFGFVEILLKFNRRPNLSNDRVKRYRKNRQTQSIMSTQDENDKYEGVTIIRPIKGIDPELSSCLESSFCQNYPSDKLEILFCVDDPNDASIPLIKKLIAKYPNIDAKILISSNFDPTTNSSDDHYGPNPKVNNLAKGFVASRYDILWVMDSNVWASSNILKNSVISLNDNLNNGRKQSDTAKRTVKLVHHVPLALSVNPTGDSKDEQEYVLTPTHSDDDSETSSSSSIVSNTSGIQHVNGTTGSSSTLSNSTTAKIHRPQTKSTRKRFLKNFGAKLDEMFLLTSHSKFYVSLNNLAIAPCVNGKSNIYRKSDLDRSVALMPHYQEKSEFFHDEKVVNDAKYYSSLGPGHSIKFFSRYIGEDNMIGIALWENALGKTGLTGDVVIQPLSGSDNGINDYITRRVRWLRVRKYMVLLATLVEPTTESIICGLYGNYAISTLFMNRWFTWWLFALHLSIWVVTDYVQYHVLINNIVSPRNLDYLPNWLINIPPVNRSVWNWLYMWALRELLALPIWVIAMFGHEIDWRGKPFKIKKDLTAEEL